MQLLYMPQETVCQVRASFIAACLKVEGCGCGFEMDPWRPELGVAKTSKCRGPYFRVARPNLEPAQ